jgi:hypothetical protein
MHKLTKQLELMWEALEEYQEQANYDGHGKSWARMCKDRTEYASDNAIKLGFASEYASNAAIHASMCLLRFDSNFLHDMHIDYALLAIKYIKIAQEKGVKCQSY